MVEITVLLPVHNGGKYLDETLYSLRNQSFADFEVLCINDCSTDDSAAVIRRHADQDKRFVYLETERNLGSASKVINSAESRASGRWFVYSSQDDLFSDDWLAQMHARALSTGADAVLPDVLFYHADGTDDRRIVGYRNDRSAILSGREAFVASLDWTIAGNALWPMTFLKAGGFDDFGAFSDEYTVRRFFLGCTKVAFCSGVFYYRQDNAAAITKKPSPSRLDAVDTSLRLWRLILENGFGPEVHGPYAMRSLRTAIRGQAMIFNTPTLAADAPRVINAWTAMRSSSAFQESLDSVASSKGFRLPYLLYRPAARHLTWFRILARLSAKLSRAKSMS